MIEDGYLVDRYLFVFFKVSKYDAFLFGMQMRDIYYTVRNIHYAMQYTESISKLLFYGCTKAGNAEFASSLVRSIVQ